MAVINFEPTWISVVRQVPSTNNYELLRTEEPIEIASNVQDGENISSILGFKMEEILKVIERSQNPSDASFKLDVTEATKNFVIALHQEDDPIESQPSPYRTTDVLFTPEESGEYLVDLDNLYFNTRYHTLAEAIGLGWNGGLFIYKSGAGSVPGNGLAENVSIQIEGDWSNQTPSANRPVGGEIQNIAEPATFSWNYNGALDQKSFEIRYRAVGESEWTTVAEESSEQSYTIPADTLTLGEYEWQVRTVSEYGFESNWSSTAIFTVAEATPTPTITQPELGSTVPISDLHVEWESEDQHEFELELVRVIGESQTTELIRNVSRTSTSTEYTFEDVLDNNETYIVRLRVNQEGGIWSSWATAFFDVEYTEPAQPELVFVTDNDKSTITVYIENPTPTGTQPNVLSQDLYRVDPSGEVIRIAKDLNPNDFFVDFTPAGNKQYEYYVRLFGDNEVNVNSNRFSASVKVRHVLINLTTNLSDMLELRLDPVKTFDTSFSAVTRTFAGRAKPVVEFGEAIEQTGSISYTVDHDTLVKLYDFLYQQETLLYRDSRGRKQFVTVSNISVSDELRHLDLYSVSLSLAEVDYNEAIE